MRYYLYSKKDEGLFDKEQLRGLDIDKDDLVKAEDADSWVEAEKVEDLADLFIPPVDFDSECGFSDDGCTQESADGADAGTADTDCTSSSAVPLPLVVEQRPDERTPLKFGRGRLAAFAAVLLALVLLGSNPKKSDHYMVAQQMVINGLQAQDHSRSWGESLMDMFFGGFSFFDSFTTGRIMNAVECHNAFLFSYSKVVGEEGSHWITFGVLGHIFPMNQEALNEHISHVLYGTRRHQPEKKQTPRRKQQQTVPEGGQSL